MDGDTRFPASADWSTVMPSYDWPRNTEEQDIDYVYHGRMGNLPRSTSKTVRIFLSSTFTDTYTERNLLITNVFPELRKYCRNKYDLDFQVVDMRWGIRHEASVDHSASELCMKEINTCNEVSLGPTFVTLLSHRYGSRPLRTRIPQHEMDILMEELKKRPADLEVVLKWYQLDTNALPHEYILKPLVQFEDMEKFLESTDIMDESTEYVDVPINLVHEKALALNVNLNENETAQTTANYQELLQQGTVEFQSEEVRLRQILKDVALRLLMEKRVTKEQAERYYISVTEEEIIEGIRKNERRRDRCLAFIRQLNDIDLKHDKAWRFIDMTDNNELDTEAQQLMTTLRDKTIPQLLPAENIYRFEATWSNDEGINEQTHAQYLQQFCDTFKRALTEQIDQGVRASKFTSNTLFSDLLEHSHQCVAKVQRFHGREEILNTIKDYIMSGGQHPLTVLGESGCGKTSVLAKAAKMVPHWLGDNINLIVAVRFLGTTPESSTIYKTLTSVCQQLINVCSLQHQFPELPQEFFDLKDTFRDILGAVPDTKRVVLFLDSLDQLADTNSAYELHWLPKLLPNNVKMVCSVLPLQHDILDKMWSLLPDDAYYLEVPNINTHTSHTILTLWLRNKQRQLSPMQGTLVDDLLQLDVSPLYLKLVFDECSTWKSYEMPIFDCRDIESCLARLYRRIETRHGQTLVSKALGYISASLNGLTELELEDILSLDDEVLNDVFEFHMPPTRRLPSILWARIRRDLDEYIVDREADGTKVMAWYHRQFVQGSNKRYLGTDAFHVTKPTKERLPLYFTIQNYFAGIWSGDTPKPFVYSDWYCRKRHLKNPYSAEIRHVAAQPTTFTSPDGSTDIENPHYNLRKISELPHACAQLALVNIRDMMPFIAKYICLNPEFLSAWVKNKAWHEVSEFMRKHSIAKYGETLSLLYMRDPPDAFSPDKRGELLNSNLGLALQIATVRQCLMLSYTSVRNNPTILGADITGKLLLYRGSFDGIDAWMDYCDTTGRHMCALVAPHTQLAMPGGAHLLTVTNHDSPVLDALWLTQDENVCCSFSSKVVAFSTVNPLGQVFIDTHPRSMPSGDSFHTGVVVTDQIFACLRFNPWIYIFDKDGDVVQTIKLDIELTQQLGPKFNIKIKKMQLLPGTVILLYLNHPHIVLLYEDKACKLFKPTVLALSSRAPLAAVTACPAGLLTAASNSQIAMLQLEEYGSNCAIKKESVLFKLEGQLVGPQVVAHDVKYCWMLLSIRHPASIHMLGCQHRVERYVFDETKYGFCHYIKLHREVSAYRLSVGCTDTHLLLLVPAKDLFNPGDDFNDECEDYKDNSKLSKSKRCNQRLKLIFRVKRRYDLAELTKQQTLITAREGAIDIFLV